MEINIKLNSFDRYEKNGEQWELKVRILSSECDGECWSKYQTL